MQTLAKLLAVGYSSSDIYLHCAPLFHIGGLSSALAVLAAGAMHVRLTMRLYSVLCMSVPLCLKFCMHALTSLHQLLSASFSGAECQLSGLCPRRCSCRHSRHPRRWR